MKNYVKEYSGYKVPEGATHWLGGKFAKWINNEAIGVIGCFQGATWRKCSRGMPRQAIELPEAPQEWNGEGLPPVGCRCSATWLELPDGGCNDFCEVAIKGYFDGEVWLSKVNGVGYSEVLKVKDCEFRPLKTQQEKDREAFVKGLVKVLNSVPNGTSLSDLHAMAEKAYGAGYTAPKAADNDKK